MQLTTLLVYALLIISCGATPATDGTARSVSDTKTATSDDNDGVPEVVLRAFEQKYAGASKVQWERDKNDYYEAHFELKGERYRADFESSGKWIETEQSIKKKHLPKAIKKVIEERYDDPKIYEIERVDHHSKGIFYDVEIKHDGDKLDVMVREDGQIIGLD